MSASTAATAAAKADTSFVLANGLVLAEFDIDKGACVRTYYPRANSVTAAGVRRKPIGVNVPGQAEYFANHMLPDGAEKLTVGRTIFVVNRPRPSPFSRFAAYVFLCGDNGQWTRPTLCAGSVVSDILLLDMKAATLSARFKDEVLVEGVPVVDGAVVVAPSLPTEVLAVANNLAHAPAAHVMPPVSTSGTPGAGSSAAATGSSGGSVDTGRLTFLVVKNESNEGAVLGLLMTVSQREKLFEALKKALAPPTPPPEPLFASEEEPPHPPGEEVNREVAGGDGEDEEGAASADDAAGGEKDATANLFPEGAVDMGEGGEGPTHVDPVPPVTSKDTAAPQDNQGSPPIPTAAGETATPQPVLSPSATLPDNTVKQAPAQPLELPAVATTTTAASEASPSLHSAGSSGVTSPVVRLGGSEENSGEVLYGLCAVVSKRDASARRGGRTKAVALLGPSLAWLEPFFPILVEAAQYCCDIPGHDADAVQQQSKVLKLCYEAINAAAPAVSTGMSKTSRLSAEVARYSSLSGAQEVFVTQHTAPFGTTHKLRIPLTPSSHDITFHRYSLEGLMETFGPGFLHLVKGIMTEKRIIVLSRMGLSTDVAEAAIALGTLGSLLDPTFVAKKVFPYTSINSVEHFSTLPSYVIGTLNPIFENEKVWQWDVLCDLDKKTIHLGEKFSVGMGASGGTSNSGAGGAGGGNSGGGSASGAPTSKRQMFSNSVGGVVSSLSLGSITNTGSSSSGGGGGGGSWTSADFDSLSPQTAQFFKDLVGSISRMRALRVPAAERNRRLRLTLEEFMQTAVMVTYTQGHPGVSLSHVALKDHFTNPVMNALRAECRLTSMMDDVRSNILFPGEDPTLMLYTATLRRLKGIDSSSIVALLQALAKLMETDGQVRLFLRRMTVAVGGLNPLSIQLTHPSQAVRAAAYDLLRRVDKLSEGKAAVAAMNGFLILVYEDYSRRFPVAK